MWGSWCAPCRVYNKELVKLYEEYNPKGLVFVSVAYDNLEEDWKKAIVEDKMIWKQLYYNQAFLDDYNVLAYPTTFLISPDQIILKRANKITKEDIDEFLK